MAKDPSKQGLIGQRQGFSNLDIKHANTYLKCGEDGGNAFRSLIKTFVRLMAGKKEMLITKYGVHKFR